MNLYIFNKQMLNALQNHGYTSLTAESFTQTHTQLRLMGGVNINGGGFSVNTTLCDRLHPSFIQPRTDTFSLQFGVQMPYTGVVPTRETSINSIPSDLGQGGDQTAFFVFYHQRNPWATSPYLGIISDSAGEKISQIGLPSGRYYHQHGQNLLGHLKLGNNSTLAVGTPLEETINVIAKFYAKLESLKK